MPFWNNPIFRMEVKRFGRPRVWPRAVMILGIAGVLGGLHNVYQGWLQNLLFNTLPWSEWSFTLWRFVYNGLNPWRWISIFAVYYLIRSPMRLVEVEEFWVTRLKPREILLGKMAVMYLFFLFLFNFSLFLSLIVRELYEHFFLISPFNDKGFNLYIYTIYLNPAYYIYMLLAPAYASIILTSIMLSVKNVARAFAVALLFYLVLLPFAQDWLVGWSFDNTGRLWGPWRRTLLQNLEWMPENLRYDYVSMVTEYAPRSVALVALMIPFGMWLFASYQRIMLRNFEYRHF